MNTVANSKVCSIGFGLTWELQSKNCGIVRKHTDPRKAIPFDSNNLLDMANKSIALIEAESILMVRHVTKVSLSLSPKK